VCDVVLDADTVGLTIGILLLDAPMPRGPWTQLQGERGLCGTAACNLLPLAPGKVAATGCRPRRDGQKRNLRSKALDACQQQGSLSRVYGISRSTSETRAWTISCDAESTNEFDSGYQTASLAGFFGVHQSIDKISEIGHLALSDAIWCSMQPNSRIGQPSLSTAPGEPLIALHTKPLLDSIMAGRQGMKERQTAHAWRGTSSSPLP
jgi:hypothetical protein